MKPLPKTRWVGDALYQVRRVPAAQVGHGGDQGECKVDEGLILVADHLPTRIAWPVLRHELGHASWFQSGAHAYLRKYLSETLTNEVEEDLCNIWLPVYGATIGVK